MTHYQMRYMTSLSVLPSIQISLNLELCVSDIITYGIFKLFVPQLHYHISPVSESIDRSELRPYGEQVG